MEERGGETNKRTFVASSLVTCTTYKKKNREHRGGKKGKKARRGSPMLLFSFLFISKRKERWDSIFSAYNLIVGNPRTLYSLDIPERTAKGYSSDQR